MAEKLTHLSVEEPLESPADLSFAAIDPEEDFDLFDSIPADSGKHGESDNTMISYYLDPELTSRYREADGMPPMDTHEFTNWLSQLDPAARASLDRDKAIIKTKADFNARAHEKLTTTVPELYDARLPAGLAARLDGKRYALGFNQTGAASADEATSYLSSNVGIDIGEYNLAHRFMIFDEGMLQTQAEAIAPMLQRAIESGNYDDARIGRFVAAFPEAYPEARHEEQSLSAAINIDRAILPNDLFIPTQGGKRESVASKYVAGFIDDQGDFWENKNFMTNNEPDFQKPYLQPAA